MTDMHDKLSAFLDGELTEAEAQAVEDALADDPALQAELEGLMAADVLAQEEFAEIASEPVPLGLAAAIRNAPEAAPAPQAKTSGMGWLRIAATLAVFAIGGAGGYVIGQSQAPQAPGWLAQIADYHAVYATQQRHLVEVSADEADHIQTWLTATVGSTVQIPDLSQNGLTFQGGRLLVAAGKPVAQLMYTDAAGKVVALCLIASDTPQDGFSTRTLRGFEMVSWGGTKANFVVVGDEGRSDLQQIAEDAALKV